MPSRRLCLKRLNQVCDRAEQMREVKPSKLIDDRVQEIRDVFAEYQRLLGLELVDNDDPTLDDEFLMAEEKVSSAISSLLEAKTEAEIMPATNTTHASIQEFLQHQAVVLSTLAESNRKPASIRTALPKFVIPPFSGDRDEWVQFRDLFQSTIEENDELTGIQKLQFLRNFVRGEAASLIRTIPISEANFSVAWETLNDNYNKDSLVVDSILNRFYHCNKVSPAQTNLKSTYHIFRETFEMLRNQGAYANSKDSLAIYLMLQKLDSKTDSAWAKHSKNMKEPSIAAFLTFLKDYCAILDRKSFKGNPKSSPVNAKALKPLEVNTVTTYNCFFCAESHSIYRCPKFLALDVSARDKFVSQQSRCFNCLAKGHGLQACSSEKSCTICRKKHNTLLHREQISKKNVTWKTNKAGDEKIEKLTISAPSSSTESNTEGSVLHKVYSICAASAIIPTAVVDLVDVAGGFVQARVLLDSGAQISLISEAMMRRLHLPRTKARIPLSCIIESSKTSANGRANIEFRSRFDNSAFHTSALIMPRLSGLLPQNRVNVKCAQDLRNKFELADPNFDTPGEIHMILSASFLFALLQPSLYFESNDKVYVQASRLGHIVCNASELPEGINVNKISLESDVEDEKVLEKFWALEEIPAMQSVIEGPEDPCEEFFRKTTSFLPSGRFCVRLPFRSTTSELGESYHMAQRRLLHLEKRFESDSNLKKEYHAFMDEYAFTGHMVETEFQLSNLPSSHYIIPHHGIWQQGPAGKKLRVVFDASAKTSTGNSLNDILHCGPRLQTEIVDVLLNFRTYKYVLMTDVEKMYRQIVVHPSDQDFQMILWRSSPSDKVKVFRLTTVTYGASTSPFLALRVMLELAERQKTNFPKASEILMKCRYMDDIFFGSDTRDDLRVLKNELICLLKHGGFNLKKWASNSRELISDTNEADLVNPLLVGDTNISIKTLGISWKPQTDVFSFVFSPLESTKNSKRSLLSETARFYDPMGWISPMILSFKALFQETWARKLDWDAPLPEDLSRRWEKLRSDARNIDRVRVPRYLGTKSLDLHGFADASQTAYAAVIYTRSIDSSSRVHTRLLFSKTKLSPIKIVSIPRLELCAAHLLAKLMDRVKSQMTSVGRITYWSDSTTVLAWLKSLPRKWSSFVANRVGHIQELCGKDSWNYVRSADNPADIASRGSTASQLVDSKLWWSGPSFLSDLQFNSSTPEHFETTEEAAGPRIHNCVLTKDMWIEFVSRFSNFNRLLRSTSYLFRFISIIRKSQSYTGHSHLTSGELLHARNFLIKIVQRHHFGEEFNRVNSGDLPKSSSSLRKLSPFLDHDGMLRVGGRLRNSVFSLDQIHPIILPKCHFSDLVIRKTHLENFHSGLTLTCAQVKRSYWIVQLQRSVKSLINSCVRCRRYQGETFQPPMGQLPAHRVEADLKPFTNTGLDFAGPIAVRPYRGRGKTTLKGFIAVFVCLSTKAVHLELVMDLTIEALIMTIRRFLARRGRCRKFYSDNGRNFVGASRVLRQDFDILLRNCNSPAVSSFLANQSISWEFIPRYSPHFGWIWEAAVKSTKRHLMEAFNGTTLTIEEFQTVICQIESVLNSRPLTPLSFEEFLIPITPQHLLTGNATAALPTFGNFSNTDATTRRRKLLSNLVEQFWKNWRDEYLPQLLPQRKWTRRTRHVRLGEIVLIKRSFDPPCFWKVAKVEKLYPGKDGVTRVVDVRTSKGIQRDSLRNIIPLNVDASASTGGSMLTQVTEQEA